MDTILRINVRKHHKIYYDETYKKNINNNLFNFIYSYFNVYK